MTTLPEEVPPKQAHRISLKPEKEKKPRIVYQAKLNHAQMFFGFLTPEQMEEERRELRAKEARRGRYWDDRGVLIPKKKK